MHPAVTERAIVLSVVLPGLLFGHTLGAINIRLEAVLTLQRVTSNLKLNYSIYSNNDHHDSDEPNHSLPQLPLESRVANILPLNLIRKACLSNFQPLIMEVCIIDSLLSLSKAATAEV